MTMTEPVGYAPNGYLPDAPNGAAAAPVGVAAPPVNIVVTAPAPAPLAAPAQTLVTPPVVTGTATSEFAVTVAEMVVYLLAGVLVSINPGLALSSTEQSTLGGLLVVAFSWAATHFRHGRTQVKVAQLSNTAVLPADPGAGTTPPVTSPAPAPVAAPAPPGRHYRG